MEFGVVVSLVSLAATVIGISGVIAGLGRMMGKLEAATAASSAKEAELTRTTDEQRRVTGELQSTLAGMRESVGRIKDIEDLVGGLREAFAAMAAGNRAEHGEVTRRLEKLEHAAASLGAQIGHVAAGGAGRLVEFDGKRG